MHSSWVRWYFEVIRKDKYTEFCGERYFCSLIPGFLLSPGFLIKAKWTAEELHHFVRQIKIPGALDWMA